MNRSATPLVSGSRTKAKLGVMPKKAIWVWKWSDIKALPWSWRSRRPRAASARTAPQALWMARSRAWAAAKRSAFSATCQPSASAFQCSTTTKRAMLEEGDVAVLNGRDHGRVRDLLQSWGRAEKAAWPGPDQAAIPNRVATKAA